MDTYEVELVRPLPSAPGTSVGEPYAIIQCKASHEFGAGAACADLLPQGHWVGRISKPNQKLKRNE